jgi:hypothetical protein
VPGCAVWPEGISYGGTRFLVTEVVQVGTGALGLCRQVLVWGWWASKGCNGSVLVTHGYFSGGHGGKEFSGSHSVF